jgi:hypothetical protein
MSPKLPTIFFAKTWYLYVGAIVFTALAAFSAIMGPLFLLEIIKPAHGRPGTEAGIALSVMAAPMCLIALLGWFNIRARRRPLLRICDEGLEINVIGASSLDGVPLLPIMVRIAWLIVSLQGFKKQIGWIPWPSLRTVQVRGLPMARTLVIAGTIVYPTFRGEQVTARIANAVSFRDAEFQDPLDTIADAISAFALEPEACSTLPSLHD